MTYQVVNPATGEAEETFATATDLEVVEAVERADAAYRIWRMVPVAERASLLARVAERYAARREEIAAVMTREMGKPVFQAGIEIDIVVSIYRYYAEHGEAFSADEVISTAAGTARIVRQGLGALLGIMPWNFPHYQVARFVAPNLVNGNSVIVKHAPQTPRSAALVPELFAEAGAPEGLVQNLFATNEQVSTLIADRRVAGVSLTGSERAGRIVAEQAGRHLKKVVLELGGSDACILLDDADLATAVQGAVMGRFGNTGQACNAAKRIIVTEGIADAFIAAYAEAVAGLPVGDPASADVMIGPLSSITARDGLAAQVADALARGATALVGGAPGEGTGAYYAPTVLTGVTPEMRAWREELFGPVAVVHRVADEAGAVALANDSDYGLGAAVYTDDPAAAERVARQLEVGMVSINAPGGTAAELPFGGVKRSGIGRELGRAGMNEFVNLKLITVAPEA